MVTTKLIRGHLDTCSSDGISGWAWCPGEPIKVNVVCEIDGHEVMRALADQFRSDLRSAGIGNGEHAFTLKIPPRFFDGRTHTVSLRASYGAVKFELTGSPMEFRLAQDLMIDGDFGLSNDGLLYGWVIDKAMPSRHVSVDVLAEGVGKINLTADMYRQDLLELGDGSGKHGFQTVLPRDWYSQRALTIQVQESKTGKQLGGKSIRFDTELSYFKRNQVLDSVLQPPTSLRYTPLISVILPVYNPDPGFLEAAIQSVKSQSYSEWQLCVADDASPNPEIGRILQKHVLQDARIRLVLRKENGHISEASNSALELADGEFFALLDHDDLLHRDALLEVAQVISRHPDVGIIFTDEDKCDEHGMRYGPYYKTGWDPELLLGQNCISHLGVYRTNLVRKLGGFRRGFEGSQDYDLALRVSRSLTGTQIQHIPRPLYHWRAIPGSTALANSEKSYAVVAMHKALRSHLDAIGSAASCESAVQGVYCRVRWPIPSIPPSVTIVLPLADSCTSTAALVKNISALKWPGMQIVTSNIQASDPIADITARRFDYLKAMSAAAKGDVFIWLEQSLPVGDLKDWFNELVSQALRADIGIVGTKVIDQTKHVRNAGLSYRNPVHEEQYEALYEGLAADDPGHGGAAGLCRSVQAISQHAFACRRTTLLTLLTDPGVGRNVPVMTELSLRAKRRHLRTLVTPFAITMLTQSHTSSSIIDNATSNPLLELPLAETSSELTVTMKPNNRLVTELRSPELDLEFYRGWYPDLRTLDNSSLLHHWEQFGKNEARAPSFAALLSMRGLDADALPDDFSIKAYLQLHPLLAADPVKSEWEAIVHYLSNATKAEKAVLASNPHTLAVPTELDLAFYRSWHPDLTQLTDNALLHHWDNHGKKEGRVPSFAALLEADGIDINQLPRDFSAVTYLKLNPQLRDQGVKDNWSATLHYLTSENKGDYKFDRDFYTRYYHDLASYSLDPVVHFVEHGKAEGRVKTSVEYWAKSKSNAPELDGLIDVRQFLAVNPDLAVSEYLATKWNVVDYLVEKGVNQVRPVSTDPLLSAEVYYQLGNGLASRGDRKLAEKAYSAACAYNTKHTQALQHLADICLTEGRFLEAITFYRLALETAPPSANTFWSHYNLSVALDGTGQHGTAIEHLCRARCIDTNMHHARDRHEQAVRREWDKLDLQARSLMAVSRIKDAEALYIQADALIDTLFVEEPVPAQSIGAQPRVALVVDPFLPQCVRYRVKQKVEQFELLGWQTSVLDWPNIAKDSFRKLAFADVVVFYRVPALFDVAYLMKQCRQAGKTVVFEIDDLVFDSDLYPEQLSSYGGLIDVNEYLNLVRGTALFLTALKSADYALASTETLAAHMAPLVRTGRAFVHRNGLDSHTAPLLERHRNARKSVPFIFYGTGTKAHNADFDDLVAPALARILAEFPDWKLMVAGYLTLPQSLSVFEDRTVRVGFISDVDTYLSVLSEAQINIAVLHNNSVNDCKSELKWFEAGAHGIPSVVSPTKNYLDVTHPGHDVLVASSPEEWYQELKRLVSNPDFRKAIGENARASARKYTPAEQSRALERVFNDIANDWNARLPERQQRQKIVVVNVFFPPQSIGGATRVVEDNLQVVLEQYSEQFDIEVFTSDHANPTAYLVNQYSWNGIRVTKVSTPQKAGMDWDYQNEEIGKIFDDYLRQVKPSLVHFHCIQRLTASIVEVTQARGIPYFVTAHDAWWISDFQFLVDEDGAPCDLRQNDIGVLATQSKHLDMTLARQEYLRGCLGGAEAILPVSTAFAEIYRLNGFANVTAVRNGVMPHEWKPRLTSPSGKVRIAHIGGMSPHKGYHLFHAALASYNFENIEAIVVDLSKEDGYRKKAMIGDVPVTYIGRVSHNRIAELYAQFDVLTAPSIWPESFGLVTREAVAAGCWVIASDIGAIGEDIEQGKNGFVVAAGELSALKTVLHEINGNPSLYLGENKNRSVRQVAEQVQELVQIYSNLKSRIE